MSSETGILVLLLDGPLQSWGHSSRFQRRTTALHPTRSGITGMLCAALGLEKGSNAEHDWIQRLAPPNTRLFVFTMPRQAAGRRHALSIRRLEDFHTVSGTRSADNKPKRDAVISHRQYLLDARFGVFLYGDREMLGELDAALRDPTWGIWLGRKSCIPAAVVTRGVVKTEQEAMEAIGLEDRELTEFAVVGETETFAEGTDTIMDVPVNFETREFAPRRIEVRSPETRKE